MAKVYCFGNTENGELGLGGIEEEYILVPRKQRLPYDRRKYSLISVASGRNHTLMLLRNISLECNVVFSCGSNERQQLGRVGSWKKLEVVDSLSQHNILSIACGANNCLVLSEAGQLFTWGCNLFGQLGLCSREEQEVGKPSLVKKLAAKNIVQIACGSNHCLALTKNGLLFAWGSNAFGQLGIGKFGNCVSTPTQLICLQWTPILKIAAGGSHSAVVSYLGSIYLWGKNEFGQLGLNDTKNRNLPTLQLSLRDQKITFISLGEEHSAALTSEGGLFTFGAGMYGQLGHGRNTNEILPRKVFELMGRTIVQVSCGRCHTLVATNCGRVYSFGLNGSGQLGIGSTQSKYVPTVVRGPWIEVNVKDILIRNCERSLCAVDFNSKDLLNSQNNENVVYISAEVDSSTNVNETASELPVDVDVSMEIDEITDENIPTGSTVLSENSFIIEEPDDVVIGDKPPGFVCNDKTVFTNKNQSIVIDEYESDPDSDVEEDPQRKQFVLKEIVVSRGDQSFVLLQPYGDTIVPRDFQKIDSQNEILKLDNSLIEQFKDVSKESLPFEIVDYIEDTFSSIASWNASYVSNQISVFNEKTRKLLKFKKNFRIDLGDLPEMDNGRIDWNQAFHGFNMIEDAQNERITELIFQSICKILNDMPDISFKDHKDSDLYPEYLDEEVLRVYQLIPLFHLFRMSDTYSENSQLLITLYAKSILRLSKAAASSLTIWWLGMEKRYFKSVIQIFKKSIEFNLLEQHRDNNQANQANQEENKQVRQINHNVHQNLAICLEVLKLFYYINKTTETVSYKEFYIDGISDLFDLKVDYVLWKNSRGNSQNRNEHFLCNYPFIFDAPAKNLILATDSEMQQQSAAESSVYRQIMLSQPIHGQIYVNPFLVISVHRNTILQETINQLCLFSKHNVSDFKKPLRIYFEGEEAIDAGQGMKKEFFLLLMKDILDEKYGMFMEYKETNTIWFHHSNEDDLVMYQLIGILCGLAIYNKVIINLPYPLVLYKKILKEGLELDDLSYLDPLLAKNLKEIVATTFEKEEFDAIFSDLNFMITLQTFGSPVEFELCPDGQSKRLTYDNREEYVTLYWQYILENSIKKQFDSFQEGFMKVLDTDILNIFHAEELMQLVSGQEVQDWEELESATDYKPPFHKDHPTIKLFWRVFHGFSKEEKKKFLLFLTGSDRIPILGVKALNVIIQPMKVSEDHLPVAHTCFNILDLPQDYTSDDCEEKLRSKLLKACDFTHGFALV